MGRSVAQPATVSIAVEQTVTISNPVESRSTAQVTTVTMGTDYILVLANPASRLPET